MLSGVKEIRAAVDEARRIRREENRGTVLFIDEVHRFNKSQQDALLPHVEDGTVVLIGATTENPSFELNSALLSRARVYVLRPLDAADVQAVLEVSLADAERGLGGARLDVAPELLGLVAEAADGDARRGLNLLEIAADLATDGRIDRAMLDEILAGRVRRFDKGGDVFYDQISALHKSVRGSSPDGALYWLCRMLDGGCDPLYVARRVVRMASEDIGNADPRALEIALAAWDVQERLGSPEGELAVAQAVRLPRRGAEEQRGVRGLRRGDGGRTRLGVAGGPRPPAQRPDAFDEGAWVRAGLPVRSRRARGLCGGGDLPAGRARRGAVLPADRPRARGEDSREA